MAAASENYVETYLKVWYTLSEIIQRFSFQGSLLVHNRWNFRQLEGNRTGLRGVMKVKKLTSKNSLVYSVPEQLPVKSLGHHNLILTVNVYKSQTPNWSKIFTTILHFHKCKTRTVQRHDIQIIKTQFWIKLYCEKTFSNETSILRYRLKDGHGPPMIFSFQ